MTGEVKKSRKNLLVMMIAAVILMAVTFAGAGEAYGYSGEGTEEHPYEIGTVSDWDDFVSDVRMGDSEGIYYKLTSDLEVTMPVGSEKNPFAGHFSGDGHTITAVISDTATQGTAVFRYISNAVIENVTVSGTVKGDYHASGLVGFTVGKSTVSNCQVKATVNGGDYVGGIVGHGKNSELTISDCEFSGVINGGNQYAGGILGWSDGQKLTMDNCLFSGSYKGSGRFHPIALKSPKAGMNADISRAYYVSTAEPKDIDGSNNVASEIELVYAKADADVTVQHFYKAVVMNGRNTQHYCPVKSMKIEMNQPFYQTSDTVLTYTVKIDGEEVRKDTDYSADLAPADYPSIQISERQVLAQAGQYMICVNGQGDYLGKWVSHFVVTRMKGNGTSADPYIMGTELEWVEFTQIMTSGNGYDFEDKYLKLTADVVIDRMAGSENHPFKGTFDGQDHKLQCVISAPNEKYAAPFHYVMGAEIKNLTVEGTVVGSDHSAGLIGYTLGNKDSVENKIDRVVVATTSTSSDYGAGIVGFGGDSKIVITNTIFSGKVCCNLYNRRYTGAGIVGRNDGCDLVMENCINKGSKGSKFVWWNPISLYTGGFRSDIKTTYYTENVAKGDDYGTTSNVGGQLAYKSAPSDRICEKIMAVDNVSYFVDPAVQIKDLKEVYSYTGSEIAVSYTVARSGNRELVKNTDYTEKFSKTVKDKGSYTLIITGKGDYTGSISKSFNVADQLKGSGTEEDPFTIGSASDWNIFKESVKSGYTYKGEFVKMTADVSIGNNMVGTAERPFSGTFDGQGHTLTAGISGKDENMAPFAYVNGATIKDLTVAGSVEGGRHSAGLAGRVLGGTLTVSTVEVKAVVRTYDKHLGGFVGHTVECPVNITDSVFSGELNFTSVNGYAGGFTGWSDKPIIDIDNCMFSGKATGAVQFFHPAGVYYVGGTGYLTGKSGVVYYTASGAPQGSEDGFAKPLRDHDVAAKRIYTRNETKSGSLYKALYLNGEETEYYTKATISGISTEPFFVNSQTILPYEDRIIDPAPKIRYDDDLNVDTSKFSISYYIKSEEDEEDDTYYPTDDVAWPGEYKVEAEAKENTAYAGSVSNTFRVISLFGAGTEEDPYKIYDEDDWSIFSELISKGYTFKGKYVQLFNSIDVTVPAGTEGHPFEGKFDGLRDGVQRELHVDLDDTSRSMAPFGAVANGAVIKNLNVTGTVKGGQHSGGLVGFAEGGRVEISNVHVSADIPAGTYVGGLVAHGKKSELIIRDSSFSGKIAGGSTYAGGLLGWSDGQKLTMERCIFSGQYLGSGKFHPIAVREAYKTMNATIRKVYYLSTQSPDVDGDHTVTAGTPVYTKATYPEDKLVSGIETADGNTYYAETKAGTVEESYGVMAEGIAPVPTVSDAEGNQLSVGQDYNAVYTNLATLETVKKITEPGEYRLVLRGNKTKSYGEQEAGSFMAMKTEADGISLNIASAALCFDEDRDTVQLEYLVTPVTATNKDVVWTSSNEEAATVDENGLVTAKGEGTAVITVTSLDNSELTDTAEITVTKSEAERTVLPTVNLLSYTGLNQFLVTPGSSTGGTLVYKLAEEESFSRSVPEQCDAGDYLIQYKVEGDEQHTDSATMMVQATIAKAQGGATIKKAATLKSGGTLDLDDLVSGEDISKGVTFEITDDDDTGSYIAEGNVFTAGSYGTVTVKATVAERDNYSEFSENIVIRIDPKDLESCYVMIDNWTYGEAGKDPVYYIPGTPAEEDVTFMYAGTERSGKTYEDISKQPTEAGSYQVYIWYQDDDHIYFDGQDFTIYPKDIEEAEVTLGDALTYTGEEQDQQISKVMLGDTDITGSCTAANNRILNAGEYSLNVVANEMSNYMGSVEVSFTVAKADPVYTAPKAVEGLVYDGSEKMLIEPGTVEGGVMRYNAGAGEFTEKIPTGIEAGTYLVNYRIKGDSNHNSISGNHFVEATIEKAECTIGTAPSAATGLAYTGEEMELVSAGSSPDGDILYRVGTGDDAEFSADIPKAKESGEYEVYYKAAARDENHKDSEVKGPVNVVIGKKQGEIETVPEAVKDLIYDGEEHALVEAGEANGCDMLYRLKKDGEFVSEYTDAVPTAVDAGEYEVWYKAGGDDDFAPSEEEAFVAVTIDKAPFPGNILSGAVSAGFEEEVDITALVSAGKELEYSILDDQTDNKDCSIDNGILTTGTGEGRCHIEIRAAGTDNYEPGYMYVNISDIEWTDIEVYQDPVTYGKEEVDPKYDEYEGIDDEETASPILTYTGTLLDGSRYGETAEEYNAAPTEAGTYNVDVFYVIGDKAYFGTTEFSITPADLKDAVVTLGDEIKYNGEEQTQEVAKIELDGKDITELCEVTDNKVTDAGTYELTVTPKDEAQNYIGSAKAKFIMYPDDETLAAAKEAALKELRDEYKTSDYSGKEKAAVEKALAEAEKAIGEARTLDEIEAAKAAAAEKISGSKKENTLKAKGRKIKAKYSKLKKKTLKYKKTKGVKVTEPVGSVTYKRVKVTAKKKLVKQARKKIRIAKNGRIVLKKGLKKGTYKIRVKVMAAGNRYYKAGTKTVTMTIRVK